MNTGQGRGEHPAVVLLNMGGPDSLEAVRPFLENLFSDPDILRFPLSGVLQKPLARWIASRRSRRVRPQYERIGGKSPLAEITLAQAARLEEALASQWPGVRVHVAMRYWHPRAAAVARALREDGAGRILVVPLYPHYCRATTGSSLKDLEAALRAEGLGGVPRTVVRSWYDFPPYADALAETVGEALDEVPGATVLFSAHGVPVRLIEAGDPYLDQVRGTVAAVMERLPGVPHRLAFQSRTGPVRWLEPSVERALEALAREGVRRVVVVAVSFVSDHIETLYEIDVQYRALAESLGLEGFRRVPALNTRPSFIRALAELVRTHA
ncbi:MAG: ferrochelatase [Deferrisomatales bacterium]